MSNITYDQLRTAGEMERLDRRLQLSPQPRVFKLKNQDGNPPWIIDWEDGNFQGTYRKDSWYAAVELALYLHRLAREQRVGAWG